ncbi:ABC transporter periplasmic protein [Halorubrum lipolyticum DSM 21995]|uniref:ABC transporter periplasmic protein n=2 Tax=Halorubrum lipolyticum TaxID=368624 RepID=M0NSV6_9EURY|nr:ABC transporter periplasmic protein [Halorubrum lipolyticum DSM 21995]
MDGEDGEDGEDGGDSGPTYADQAQAAWERAVENPLPEDEDLRQEAYVEMEEAVRDDAVLTPLYHGFTELFWYDYVDVPLTGALGKHWQQLNTTTVEGDDTLNLINSTFDELDPIMSTDTASSIVITQIYENLTEFPNGVPEVENQLLEEYEVSEDGTTWTFTLKEDIQFHGGGTVTAQDVKYSWRRTVESANSERATFTLNQPTGLGIDVEMDDEGDPEPDSLAVEVIDDQTLEIQLVGPNPDVLSIIAYSSFAVIPEGYVDDIEGYDGEVSHDEFSTDVANGTGPFELDEFNVDEDVSVVRNDDYWGETASVEAVNWEIIEDDQAAWTYSLEQNADRFEMPTFAYEADAIDAEEDDRGRQVGTYGPAGDLEEEVNYLGVSEISTFYFGFNASNTERAARQAVAYVMNKEQIVQEVFAGRGTPAYSFLPPAIWPTGQDGYESFLEDYPYGLGESDSQGAQTVLEEAGFTSDSPTEMTLTTYESEVFQTAAELIRDLLSGTGLDLSLETSQFSTLQSRGEDGELQMYSLGWIWSWPAVPYGMFQLEPLNTNTSVMPEETNGFYLDWHTNLEEEAE